MRIIESSNRRAVGPLVDRGQDTDPAVVRRVAQIVAAVRRSGDTAVLRYARQFDQLLSPVEVTGEEMQDGLRAVAPQLRSALRRAATHIRRVARRQVPRGWRSAVTAGVEIEQRVTPLDRVGCYVPAGRYPLPSSLLMTVIPARVAGVPEVVVVCPRPDTTVLAAAAIAGATQLFRLGGAHAVAALAYGTATVPKVDKIVGPGSAYVAAAKALVAADCPIDFYAGPTEIVIIATGGEPAWIAADLLAQAEHDASAQAILVTDDAAFADATLEAVERHLKVLPRADIAYASWRDYGAVIVVPALADAVALIDRIAPEHLALAIENAEEIAFRVRNAGAIFLGRHTPEALGDYVAGPNHVLPTGGSARFSSGLGVFDFIKRTSLIGCDASGLRTLGPAAITLAEAEGLHAHALSVAIRLRADEG